MEILQETFNGVFGEHFDVVELIGNLISNVRLLKVQFDIKVRFYKPFNLLIPSETDSLLVDVNRCGYTVSGENHIGNISEDLKGYDSILSIDMKTGTNVLSVPIDILVDSFKTDFNRHGELISQKIGQLRFEITLQFSIKE
jgi:hypothetical protein